jgi:hypothetical protein
MPAMRSLLVVLLLALGACRGKPGEQDCKKAIDNVDKIYGTDTRTNREVEVAGEVRDCRAYWSKEQVRCAIAAENKDDMAKCELKK